MNWLEMIKTNSKLQMVLALVIVALAAIVQYPSQSSLLTILSCVILAVGVDLLLLKFRKVKIFLPTAAVITGLIIGLIYQPDAPIYELVTVIGVAILTKNFLKIKNRHLLNPAAIGLIIGSILFGSSVSWWGVSFYQFTMNNVQFIILLVPVIVSMYLMKRYRITGAFLAGYVVITYLLASHVSLANLLDPTVLFFATVMLPEPMTSPHDHRYQLYFGGAVALLVGLMLFVGPYLGNFNLDPLVLGLLIGNLIFFKLR